MCALFNSADKITYVITGLRLSYRCSRKGVKKKIIHMNFAHFERNSQWFPVIISVFGITFSTKLALLNQKEITLSNIKNELLTLGIFIDFSKSFDCPHHKTLLQKLNHCGVRGAALNIIESYLRYRHQYVEINGERSGMRQNKTSVPQRSNRKHLLFNLFYKWYVEFRY